MNERSSKVFTCSCGRNSANRASRRGRPIFSNSPDQPPRKLPSRDTLFGLPIHEIETPVLRPVADLVVRIAAPIEIGAVAGNIRRMIPIAGGDVLGPCLRGKVLPGGADFQLLR